MGLRQRSANSIAFCPEFFSLRAGPRTNRGLGWIDLGESASVFLCRSSSLRCGGAPSHTITLFRAVVLTLRPLVNSARQLAAAFGSDLQGPPSALGGVGECGQTPSCCAGRAPRRARTAGWWPSPPSVLGRPLAAPPVCCVFASRLDTAGCSRGHDTRCTVQLARPMLSVEPLLVSSSIAACTGGRFQQVRLYGWCGHCSGKLDTWPFRDALTGVAARRLGLCRGGSPLQFLVVEGESAATQHTPG